MTTAAATASAPASSTVRRTQEVRAPDVRTPEVTRNDRSPAANDGRAPSAAPAAERVPASAKTQADARQVAAAKAKQQEQRVTEQQVTEQRVTEQRVTDARTPTNPAASTPAKGEVKAGLPGAAKAAKAAEVGDKPKGLDPNRPVLVLAPQYGDGKHDEIVKNTHEALKKEAEAQGYQVIDAANLTGADLQKKVAGALPENFRGEVVTWTGGHGSVAQDDREGGRTEHELTRTHASGRTEQVRTADDVLKPIYDAAKQKAPDGHDPQMVAMVGSCRAGETANDLATSFAKGDQKNIAIVGSSTRDQTSHGEGPGGLEAATVGFMRMLSQGSADRKAADANKDGAVSAREFVDRLNTNGGGLAGNQQHDDDQDGRPDRLSTDRQSLVLGGNGDLSLVPKGEGGKAPSKDLPAAPTTLAEAQKDIKGYEAYLEAVWGNDVKVDAKPNPASSTGVDVRYQSDTERVHAPGTPGAMNETTTRNKDGTTTKTAEFSDGYSSESHITADGRSGTTVVKGPDGKPVSKTRDTYNKDGTLVRQDEQMLPPGAKSLSTTIDPATGIRTRTTVGNDGSSSTERMHTDENHDRVKSEHIARDAKGKETERYTEYRWADHDDARPFTRSEHTRQIPGVGPMTMRASSDGQLSGTGPDGKPIDEATARKHFPEYFGPPAPAAEPPPAPAPAS